MTWRLKTLVWQKSSDRDQNAPKVPDFRTHLTSPKFRMLWNLLRKAKFNRQFRVSSVEVTKFKVASNSSEKLNRHGRVAKKIHSDETRVNTISMIHFLTRTESGFFYTIDYCICWSPQNFLKLNLLFMPELMTKTNCKKIKKIKIKFYFFI